jgi:hypothetical protein
MRGKGSETALFVVGIHEIIVYWSNSIISLRSWYIFVVCYSARRSANTLLFAKSRCFLPDSEWKRGQSRDMNTVIHKVFSPSLFAILVVISLIKFLYSYMAINRDSISLLSAPIASHRQFLLKGAKLIVLKTARGSTLWILYLY